MMEQNEIKLRRVALDWTQEELARQAAIAPATIVRAEKGETLKVPTLLKIERALDAGLRLKQGGGDA